MDINKGDLVKNTEEEIGIVVVIGPDGKCVVLYGDGLHIEGPISELIPVSYSPHASITANFIEIVKQCYEDHMTWLKCFDGGEPQRITE